GARVTLTGAAPGLRLVRRHSIEERPGIGYVGEVLVIRLAVGPEELGRADHAGVGDGHVRADRGAAQDVVQLASRDLPASVRLAAAAELAVRALVTFGHGARVDLDAVDTASELVSVIGVEDDLRWQSAVGAQDRYLAADLVVGGVPHRR